MPVPSRTQRLAAGRARAIGEPTRATTAPNRLHRVDRWLLDELSSRLTSVCEPLVVDLGFGASPITSVELATRLLARFPTARVLGLEIDPERVAAAQSSASPPQLS